MICLSDSLLTLLHFQDVIKLPSFCMNQVLNAPETASIVLS